MSAATETQVPQSLNSDQFLAKAKKGGASRSLTDSSVPSGGYMVGGKAGVSETRIPLAEATPEAVRSHRDSLRSAVAGSRTATFQGAWKEGGDVVLDASDRFENRQTARMWGRIRGEDAAYDVAKDQDIPITQRHKR
jgi:hypothetical protein